MSFILNIDTSSEIASVSLADKGMILSFETNSKQTDHAAFLHPAIQSVTSEAKTTLNSISSVAVTCGPGSYTGIRVGMAAAKGLCLALEIPLILIDNLQLLATDIQLNYPEVSNNLLCPMIDARRMEVFTSLYDNQLTELLPPCAMVLNEQSYTELTSNKAVLFFGSGSKKFKDVVKLRNIKFIENVNPVKTMATMSSKLFHSKRFSDLVYSDPLYIKEFYDQKIK